MRLALLAVLLLCSCDDDQRQSRAAAYVTRVTGRRAATIACTYVNSRGSLCDVRVDGRIVSVFCGSYDTQCTLTHGGADVLQ